MLCWCCVRQSSGNQVGVQTFLLPYKQSVLRNWTCLSALGMFFSISVIVSILSHISAHPALAVFSRTCPSWASIPSLHYRLLLSTGRLALQRASATSNTKHSYPSSGPSWLLLPVLLISPLPGAELLNLAQVFDTGFFCQMPLLGQCDK